MTSVSIKESNKKEIPFCEDFVKVRKGFIAFRERELGFRPYNISKWIMDVQLAHQKLRGKLGTISVSKEIEIVEEFDKEGMVKETSGIVDKIIKLMPDYLEKYKLTKEDLLKPCIKRVKVSKHISRHAANTLGRDYNNHKLFDQLNNMLAQFGEIKARYTTTEQKLHVTLSTAAHSFAMLGHYGTDNGSCFSQLKQCSDNKYSLSITDNTFVLIISEKPLPINPFEPMKGIIGRAWGFTDEEHKVFNVCNYYAEKGDRLPEANAYAAIRKFLADLLDTELPEVAPQIIEIDGPVYHNKYPNWSFYKDKFPNKKQKLKVVITKGF